MTKAKNQLQLIQFEKEAIQKCKVRLNPSSKCWEVTFPLNRIEEYKEGEAVIFAVNKYFERTIRYKKAQELIFKLNMAVLSLKEEDLVLNITNTAKCTKRQYGFLKGIWERQQ